MPENCDKKGLQNGIWRPFTSWNGFFLRCFCRRLWMRFQENSQDIRQSYAGCLGVLVLEVHVLQPRRRKLQILEVRFCVISFELTDSFDQLLADPLCVVTRIAVFREFLSVLDRSLRIQRDPKHVKRDLLDELTVTRIVSQIVPHFELLEAMP